MAWNKKRHVINKNQDQRQAILAGVNGQVSPGFIVIPKIPGRSKPAMRQVLALLIELGYIGGESEERNSKQPKLEESFDDALAAELQDARYVDTSDWKFFDIARNVSFLKYPIQATLPPPSNLVKHIFEYLLKHPEKCPGDVIRILPVDFVLQGRSLKALLQCLKIHLPHVFNRLEPFKNAGDEAHEDGADATDHNAADDIDDAAAKADAAEDDIHEADIVEAGTPNPDEGATCSICSHLTPAKPDDTWALNVESRITTKLHRADIIEAVGNLMTVESSSTGSKVYPVNLTDARYTVLVENNLLFLGVSVCEDYMKYNKFNVWRWCHPEEPQ